MLDLTAREKLKGWISVFVVAENDDDWLIGSLIDSSCLSTCIVSLSITFD